jgi:hypothetical protein
MPPHLHPRSTATSTLFAGTLLASFIVVGIPHVFPCPVPRHSYADSERQLQLDKDGNPIPKRTPKQDSRLAKAEANKAKTLEDEAALFRQLQQEADMLEKQARECPVPRPKGWIGRVLGFESQQEQSSAEMQQQKGKS